MDVPVYTAGTDVKPSEIARQGLEEAKKKNIDVVIVDTAGRLQVIHLYCNNFLVLLDHLYTSLAVLLLID